jgi:hypothetical protein
MSIVSDFVTSADNVEDLMDLGRGSGIIGARWHNRQCEESEGKGNCSHNDHRFFADCLRHYTRKVPVMRQNARVGCLLHAGCEKGAAGPYALETLYLAFSSSGRLMRILGSVVGPSAAFMAFCGSKVTGCSLVPLCAARSTHSILALKAILIRKYDAALLALRGETVLIETRGAFARNHLCRQIFERRGTWQVTVLATKAGQTIAQKQVSVTAEGGK